MTLTDQELGYLEQITYLTKFVTETIERIDERLGQVGQAFGYN